jgi:hypothetical protein
MKRAAMAVIIFSVFLSFLSCAWAGTINVSDNFDGDLVYEIYFDEQNNSFLRTALQPFIEKSASGWKRTVGIMLRAKAVRLSKTPLATNTGTCSYSWEGNMTGSAVEFHDGYAVMELGPIKIDGQPVLQQ